MANDTDPRGTARRDGKTRAADDAPEAEPRRN